MTPPKKTNIKIKKNQEYIINKIILLKIKHKNIKSIAREIGCVIKKLKEEKINKIERKISLKIRLKPKSFD